MRVLAIETATNNCSVALLHNTDLTYLEQTTPQSHTKALLPMIDKLLTEANISLGQIDAIAYDAGPGSFTGLRIGAGVAQGLAFAKDLPVINVSSLSAMAMQASGKYMAVALDARMSEVYFASFKGVACFDMPQVVKPAKLKLDPTKGWLLVGNGWQKYEPCFKNLNLHEYEQNFTIMPHAKEIAQLGALNFSTKLAPRFAIPSYLRPAV